MKAIIPLCIGILSISNGFSQSKCLFLSLEGSFNSSIVTTPFQRVRMFSLYIAPAVGYSLSENYNIGLSADIHSLKTKVDNLYGDDYESSDKTYDYGIFVERIIPINEVIKIRLRPLFIYRRENFETYSERNPIELRFAPGVIFAINKYLEFYTNFRGIGIADNFYFDLGFDQLNLGLQFNLNFE